MPDFQDAYTRLMRTINRPLTETDVLAEAKSALNDAKDYIQRNHAFSHTESLAQFTFPASTLYVDLGTICEGTLRDVISLQLSRNTTDVHGKPIKIKNYAQIQADRKAYDRSHSVEEASSYSESIIGQTIEDGYRRDFLAFVMGKNIGLYPRQQEAKEMIVHFHVWVTDMASNADTNFLLTYCYDALITIALKRMHLVMKLDSRYNVSQAEVDTLMAGIIAWDSQVKNNPQTSIG